MEAILSNKLLVIKDPTPPVRMAIQKLLSYKDKSKEYLLRRKSRIPNFQYTDEYRQLKSEMHGQMYIEMPNNCIAMSSGFAHIVEKWGIPVIDNRIGTGPNVAYPWINKPFDPRDYQEEAIELMLTHYRGLINFATGLGKTLTAIHAIRKIGKRTLIIVPSESIAKQFHKELTDAFGSKNVEIFSGKRKKIANITVGIAASVVRALDEFQKQDLGLIIFDEVHHIAASTFYDIAKALGSVGKLFGLTATDFRSDGKDVMITAGCGNVLIKRDLEWGIKHGWLAKPEVLVKRVPTIGRNFKNDKLKNYREHVLENDVMKHQIDIDIKTALDNGESVLILVDQVSHGEEIAKKFGIPFATGTDNKSQEYVDQLNAGKIPGLVGTDGKVGEGTDTKRVDVLILANFAGSLGPLIQAVGRGARKYGNKQTVRVHDYIPTGSDMLARHANSRVEYYRKITDIVDVIDA